jgi:hypothetical protein
MDIGSVGRFCDRAQCKFALDARKMVSGCAIWRIWWPLAYMGAERLGAVTLNAYPQSYLALSIGWAFSPQYY